MDENELILRRLLWLRHGCDCGSLYSDDGELQCHKCNIDFLRDTPQQIDKKFYEIGFSEYLKGTQLDEEQPC